MVELNLYFTVMYKMSFSQILKVGKQFRFLPINNIFPNLKENCYNFSLNIVMLIVSVTKALNVV